MIGVYLLNMFKECPHCFGKEFEVTYWKSTYNLTIKIGVKKKYQKPSSQREAESGTIVFGPGKVYCGCIKGDSKYPKYSVF